jgi:putative ABC transport system ATP-binding protein
VQLIPFLSARENVELTLELRGAGLAAAGDALEAVGLGELAGERVSRLSTGERQRVALARAIASRPKLLLADEPTARLDEANARTTGALFAQLAAETGAAIVCATHDPALIDQADARLALD